MRTTKGLIKDLDQHQANGEYSSVALVVAFEKLATAGAERCLSTSFVLGNEGTADERLQQLDSYIAAGGEPVGFFAFSESGEIGGAKVWPLKEYGVRVDEWEEWVNGLSG